MQQCRAACFTFAARITAGPRSVACRSSTKHYQGLAVWCGVFSHSATSVQYSGARLSSLPRRTERGRIASDSEELG